MGIVVAASSVPLRTGVPTHSATVTVSKRAELATVWSCTNDGRGKYRWLSPCWVSDHAITNSMPAYKFVHFLLATIFLVVRLHRNTVGWIRFHIFLVLCDHGLDARFVLRLVSQHGLL